MTRAAAPDPVGAHPALLDALAGVVPAGRLLARPIDRVAFASDASFYRLLPRAVVLAKDVSEVLGLFRLSHAHGVPLTFRAAGTSLSGQAITDGLLVEVARHWKRIQVEDGGRRLRVQPGVVGGHANQVLKPFGARIGPDPASINACTVGGILANNSSGMCCGVAQNAYHTLESLTFVLPSGTVIDTAAADADADFRAREPALAAGLLELKRDVERNAALRDRIRAKYRTKNTTGYSLNAFLDFERPVDIMRHLLVGSEGTLGFVAEAVLRTVPDLPVKYTGLLLFPDLHAACAAIGPLRDAGAVALELMDRAAMRSVEHLPGVPAPLRTLPGGAAGLLAEFQAADEGERPRLEERGRAGAAAQALLEPPRFTHEAPEQARLWSVRQGMFPSVGAVRRSGTTVIIEDVAFPVERLAEAAVDLTRLFARHAYDRAIIFGHAKDGNLHFVLTQSFGTQAAVDQYARFMDDVVRLVVERYDGALKAEHGTGRNMAPFVEAEWGAEAVAIMRRLKALVDPQHLLNPGVILNPDPQAHLRHLKPLPPVEQEVDTCIECGYCESACPSRELTLTPRQRIVVRREMARLGAELDRRARTGAAGEPVTADDGEGPAWLEALSAGFPYDALDTCAVDGLCAVACPVKIDTGALVKRLRHQQHSSRARALGAWAAEHFDVVEGAVRLGLRAGHVGTRVLGEPGMARLVEIAGRLSGASLPRWTRDVPRAARAWRRLVDAGSAWAPTRREAAAVYFPSCLTRTMAPGAPASGGPTLPQALALVAARAGRPVWVPDDVQGTCCGVPFSSKGFAEGHAVAANRAVERLWAWSEEGRLPVVVDTSPCTYGLRTCRAALSPENQRRFDGLTILDSVAFVHDELLPRLTVTPVARTTAIHPVCSLVKMGLVEKLDAVARACGDRAVVPLAAGCCGFAGDRGFLRPELTEAATRHEADEVRALGADEHISSSRTCEVGLTRATGRAYRSFLFLLEEATRPRDPGAPSDRSHASGSRAGG